MRCHVRHAPADVLPSRSCISRLPWHFVPTRSVRPAAARPPGAAGPCFRAYRLCARARAGGRIAAARLVRLIARARRRTHLARRFPPGSFSRPRPSLSAEKPKGGPGSRLSLLSFYTIPPNVKPMREQKMKPAELFHGLPVKTRPGSTPWAPASSRHASSLSYQRPRFGTHGKIAPHIVAPAVEPVLHRLRRRRKPEMGPGFPARRRGQAGAGATLGVAPPSVPVNDCWYHASPRHARTCSGHDEERRVRA